jgi:O-antigen ligase
MIFPWLYSIKKHTEKSLILLLVLVIGLAVILTYSRASWIAVAVGLFVVGYNVLRDRRVLRVGVIGLIGVASLLVLIVAVRGFGSGAVDQARQNVLERTLEAVSFYSWEQSYEGYGRIFFIINTPLVVARNYPFFGAGPGNYGSGAAAA